MQDLIFVVVAIAFFAAVAGLCAILRSNSLRTNRLRQINMNAESIIMLIVSAGLMVYLLYALLRPEKF